MIKKDVFYKWDQRDKYSFAQIKQANLDSPTLYSPDFGKDFLLYTFSSDTYIIVILT